VWLATSVSVCGASFELRPGEIHPVVLVVAHSTRAIVRQIRALEHFPLGPQRGVPRVGPDAALTCVEPAADAPDESATARRTRRDLPCCRTRTPSGQ
jgi:hypothetical protein